MVLKTKLYATAVGKIINRHDREHVGYMYEWNNGELQPAWFGSPCPEADVEMFDMAVAKAG